MLSGAIGLLLSGISGAATAQENCVNTPQGRICTIRQPIIAGSAVSVELQRQLGLVGVNSPAGTCSGTLMNRWWVLTARHCVTTNARINGPPVQPGQMSVTATWAPGRTAVGARIHDFTVNSGAGVVPDRDIVLVYLANELGTTNIQMPYVTDPTADVESWIGARLTANDSVNQYGQGFSGFATGVFGGTPPAVSATGFGTYRTAVFKPSNITQTRYDLAMNAASQVGAGGDSGGPTVIGRPDGRVFIAGVQSTCVATGYVANAPAEIWTWATGISFCSYVSVEPLVREIGRVTSETPIPGAMAAVHHYLRSDERSGLPPAILEYLLQ